MISWRTGCPASLVRRIIFLMTICFAEGVSSNNVIKVCLDESEWYPFTLVKSGKATGIHIDIITKALSNLGYVVEYRPMPWKRCLAEASQGRIDGVATASYKDERAEFLYFPADADTAKQSEYRVMQVEYVVVTTAQENYRFEGDIKTIPQPVRAPRGYSIVSDLSKQGLKVDDNAASDEINIRKLLRERRGSVVVIPELVRKLSQLPEYQNKITISDVYWKSKSYFFPIAKHSVLSERQRRRIWSEIRKIREDAPFMATVSEKYKVD